MKLLIGKVKKLGKIDKIKIKGRFGKAVTGSKHLKPDIPDCQKAKQLAKKMDKMNARKYRVTRLIPGTPGKVTGGNSTKLGKNIMESMGLKRSTKWTGYQAQHIIPSEMANNPVIQKIGMNLDDASNGIMLRIPDEGISPMSRHQGYHSVYNEVVEKSLKRMDVNQSIDVLQRQVFDLQQNLKYLQQKGLPLYPSQGATVELWERQLGKLNR